MNYSSAYKKAQGAIVNVVQINDNRQPLSTATGAIIDDGKKVLTCSHCCNKNFHNGIYNKVSGNFVEGKLIFDDIKNDIAILEFQTDVGPVLELANSTRMEIGNEIFTIGFPYNFGSEKTLTTGNIAAFENGLIKINSSVNNGNSGGPLLNMEGKIIGVVNAKLGSLSTFLDEIEKARPQAFIQIGGIDPVQTIQEMLKQMRRNLNLGIGYAIPTNRIASISPLINSLII